MSVQVHDHVGGIFQLARRDSDVHYSVLGKSYARCAQSQMYAMSGSLRSVLIVAMSLTINSMSEHK